MGQKIVVFDIDGIPLDESEEIVLKMALVAFSIESDALIADPAAYNSYEFMINIRFEIMVYAEGAKIDKTYCSIHSYTTMEALRDPLYNKDYSSAIRYAKSVWERITDTSQMFSKKYPEANIKLKPLSAYVGLCSNGAEIYGRSLPIPYIIDFIAHNPKLFAMNSINF